MFKVLNPPENDCKQNGSNIKITFIRFIDDRGRQI
jgi:hypothetical protein